MIASHRNLAPIGTFTAQTQIFYISNAGKRVVAISVVVGTTCFETKIEIKTGQFFRDQNRSTFETFGSRPKAGIIEIKTETGNYPASKNKSLPPSLINLFFQNVTITLQVNEDF